MDGIPRIYYHLLGRHGYCRYPMDSSVQSQSSSFLSHLQRLHYLSVHYGTKIIIKTKINGKNRKISQVKRIKIKGHS